MQTVKVLIVDDSRQVREELKTVLSLAEGLEVVGEAADGREAVRLVMQLQPGAVVLDLEMPVLNGYEAARQIRAYSPQACLVALTVHAYEEARVKAFRAGIDFFVVKGAPVEQLVRAIVHPKE